MSVASATNIKYGRDRRGQAESPVHKREAASGANENKQTKPNKQTNKTTQKPNKTTQTNNGNLPVQPKKPLKSLFEIWGLKKVTNISKLEPDQAQDKF